MGLILLPGISAPVSTESPIYLGSHFTWAEATYGGTRLPMNTNFQGVTIPAARITANIIALARELDIIRSDFGDRPITINSWLRPPKVNRSVGGVDDSQHLLGWAADIRIDGYMPRKVAQKLNATWKGGIGNNSAYTHVDLRHLLGWQSARWEYGSA